MSLIVTFKPHAEADLAEAYSWYEQHHVALGDKFLTSVNSAVLRIADGPERFPIVHRRDPKLWKGRAGS